MPINYLKRIQLGEFNNDGFRISPSKELESMIEGFYVFSRDMSNSTHHVFNDGYPVLVFLQRGEDRVLVTGEKKPFEIKGAWASAGSIKNVYVEYKDNTEQVFIVRFYPGAFYQLFGLDAHYFRSNPVATFEHVAMNNGFSTEEYFLCESIERKTAYIERYVQERCHAASTPESLRVTLNYIYKMKGKSTVKNIVSSAGVSYKWMERSFLKNVGLLPKEFIQLQRFLHAYLELIANQDCDLMRVAISNGYYDANHFLKDFKAYTGKTPLQYLKVQNSLVV